MKKQRIFRVIIRIVLFFLVLSVGTLVALRLDETMGLALTAPSGMQILVLLITVGLAVLVVVSHLDWAAENRQTPDYIRAEVIK